MPHHTKKPFLTITEYTPSLWVRFMSLMPERIQQVVWDNEEKIYYNRIYFCWTCKRFTRFLRCYNCGKFFCTRHADEAPAEYGEYGSVIDPGGYPICYRCNE